jgi:hypothetical protein
VVKFLTLFAVLLAARYSAPAERAARPVPRTSITSASADIGGGDFSGEKPGTPGKK